MGGEMRKIFLISLMILLIGGLAASCASKTEYPLIDAYDRENGETVVIQVTNYENIYTIWIEIDGISVKLRDDGKNYTSIIILSGYEGAVYPGGTILVPYPEDVEKWNNWLKKITKERKPGITPQRVLPPNSEKN